MNAFFTLQLDPDTFVDPNGDLLAYQATNLPSWLTFSPSNLTLQGTATAYGVYSVQITARDPWNANATLSIQIVAGTKPNTPPVTHSLLSDQTSLVNQLFYYRFPTDAFLDPDGNKIYLLVS